MLNAIQSGILTDSTKQRLEQLEASRDQLNLSIAQAQMQKPLYSKSQIVRWISSFKYGDANDVEYQKEIIDTFLNSIYVYDDKLVFTYNFKDGTNTINLEDIEKAFCSDLSSLAPPKIITTPKGVVIIFGGKDYRCA